MSLAVGTKVRIKDDLEFERKYDVFVNETMEKLSGQVTEIYSQYGGEKYRLKIDPEWIWSKDTFDVITPNKDELFDMLVEGSIDEKAYEEMLKET